MRLLRFALKVLMGRKFWNSLVIFSIVVAVTTMQVVIPVNSSTTASLESFRRYAVGFILLWKMGKSNFTNDDIHYIEQLEGVNRVFPVVVADAALPLSPEEFQRLHERLGSPPVEIPPGYRIMQDITVIGLDPSVADAVLLPYANIIDGRFLDPNHEGEAVISATFARGFDKKVGDVISVPSQPLMEHEVNFTVVGINLAALPAPLDSGLSVTMNVRDLKKIYQGELRTNALIILLKDPTRALALLQMLQQKFPDTQALHQARIASALIELMGSVARTQQLAEVVVITIFGLAVLAVRFLDGLKHRWELALLLASGWERKHVLLYSLWEAVITGLLAGSIAIISSVALGGYLSTLLIPPRISSYITMPQVPDWGFLPLSIPTALALSLLGLLPTFLFTRRMQMAAALKGS